jgi:hypothetical protein
VVCSALQPTWRLSALSIGFGLLARLCLSRHPLESNRETHAAARAQRSHSEIEIVLDRDVKQSDQETTDCRAYGMP